MFLSVRRLVKFSYIFNSSLKMFLNFTPVPIRCFCYSPTSFPVQWSDYHTSVANSSFNQAEKCRDFERKVDFDFITDKVSGAHSENEVFQSLVSDSVCNNFEISSNLIDRLLHRFQDDWKTALGVFRWAETRAGCKPVPELCDKMVDILGKMNQMEKMRALVVEMRDDHLLSLNTVAKFMRRLAGAGDWKEAVKTFDDLENFGLTKNTESMNLLLDTLCKENKVQQAREIFLELKSHILPNANTFNIFIHGWCKMNRVEEAHWTIQEILGNGLRPCVISYSTIIQFYCAKCNFSKVYELLDEMKAQGCPPNVVTFTTIMHSLTKAGELDEALQIAERIKMVGCKPDVKFYNALIHTLGRAGRVEDAVVVFTKEMKRNQTNPNTSTFNTMIAMFCHHKQEERALRYLRNLENYAYCKPDVQSFYPLLKFYFRARKCEHHITTLVNDMVKKHYLSLDLATYTLLIHGLCGGKNGEWAHQLFWDMIGQGITPRYITCSLLLREIREKNMSDAAERIEEYVRTMK